MGKKLPKFLALYVFVGAGIFLGRVGRTGPRSETKVKLAALLHYQFRQPTMPSEKAARMGDESKAAAVDPPAALLFEWNTLRTRLFQREPEAALRQAANERPEKRSIRSTLRDRGDLIGDRRMTANRDEPRPTPFMPWVAAEPLALIFGIVAIPVLAIALGVCVTILANAFR